MRKNLSAFIADDSGATAIEYGLIAVMIVVIVVAAFSALGPAFNATFTFLGSAIQGS